MATSTERSTGGTPEGQKQQDIRAVREAISTFLCIKGSPTHYELLGLAMFESDAAKIKVGAIDALAKLKGHENESGVATLIGHIKGVRDVLLSPEKKRDYDSKHTVPTATNSTHNAVQQVIAPTKPTKTTSVFQERWREITIATAAGIGTLAAGLGWFASSDSEKNSDGVAVKAPERPGETLPVTTDLPPVVQTPPVHAAISRTVTSTTTSPSPLHTSSRVTKPIESTDENIIEETPSSYPLSVYPSELYKPVTVATPPTGESTTDAAAAPMEEQNAATKKPTPMTPERREKLKKIQQEALRLEGLVDKDGAIIKGKVTPDIIKKLIEMKNFPAIADSTDDRRAYDQLTFSLSQLIEDIQNLNISLEDIRNGDFDDDLEISCIRIVKDTLAKKGGYIKALELLKELQARNAVNEKDFILEKANILMKASRSKDSVETASVIRQMLEVATKLEQDNPTLFRELIEVARGRVNMDPFMWEAEHELSQGDKKVAIEKISRLSKHPLHNLASRAHAVFTEGNKADSMTCYDLAREFISKSEASTNGRKTALLELGLIFAKQAGKVDNTTPSIKASVSILLGKYETAPKPSTVTQTPVTPGTTESTAGVNNIVQKNVSLPLKKPHNLMGLIDVTRDTHNGNVSRDQRTGAITIQTRKNETSRVFIPITIDTSSDYAATISFEVTPVEGQAMSIHLPIGKGVALVVNTQKNSGDFVSLGNIDNVTVDKNPKKYNGTVLVKGKRIIVSVYVEKKGLQHLVQFGVNGTAVYKEEVNEQRVSLPSQVDLGEGGILLGAGGSTTLLVTNLSITPHAGSISPKPTPGEKVTAKVTGK